MTGALTLGLHRGVPMAQYRALGAYGSSDLKLFRRGPPALVPWRRANPEQQTDATKIGTAAHCAIIEPDRFAGLYEHKPEGMSFATKEGKEWRAAVPEGVTILTDAEWTQVQQILAAFNGKRLARESLEEATEREATVLWQDVDTAVPLKARPDWFKAGGFITDLKISRWAGTDLPFRAYVEGWIGQLALYRYGLMECGIDIEGGRLVVVHPEPPQGHRVYTAEITSSAIGVMHLENEKTIKLLAACHESGIWPGAPDEWSQIGLPAIALTQADRAWDDEDDQNIPLTQREWR